MLGERPPLALREGVPPAIQEIQDYVLHALFHRVKLCLVLGPEKNIRVTRPDQGIKPAGPSPAPPAKDETPSELAPIYIRFLRPEIAILAADLREYGPFQTGEVAAIPYAHAAAFIDTGAAEMYGE